MTTHRQAWLQRAGVVVALATSTLLALPAASATAAPPLVQNVSASPESIEVNGTTTVTYTLRLGFGEVAGTVTVSSSNPKLTCVDRCSRTNVSQQNGQATFKYSTPATANEKATITVTASGGTLQEDGSASTDVTLVGKPAPTQAATVKEVSGRVIDSGTNNPVPNASVAIQDSAGHRYQTATNATGGYRFSGSTSNPITPGQIDIGAQKDTVFGSKTVSGSPGQTLNNQNIKLKLTAATPTATPTESEAAVEAPSDEATDATDSPQASQPAASKEKTSGTGTGSLMLIIVGGLLVALGVGAIVLLWMRRKENGDDDDPDDPAAAGPGPRGAVPPGQGADQTRVTNRAGMGADPTMVGGTGLADAPTMMHNRPLVDDEFPDPYGAPLPTQQSGYGANDQDWAGDGYGGASPQAGYGAAAGGYGSTPSAGGEYGNAPGSGAGYPVRGTGGQGEHFDEPTGRYQGGGDDYGQPADPYETGSYNASSGYGQGQQQYGQQDDYDQRGGYEPRGGYAGPNPGGGYDEGAGYGQQQGYGAQPGGYEQPASGGYDQRGGYDQQPGYDRNAGYDQGADQHGGQGYDRRGADQGYYGDRDAGGPSSAGPDQDTRRARPETPEQANRSGRRSLDWLDD